MGNNQTVTLGNTAKQRIYDRTDLKLTLDDLPESTMYLKSYTGSTYGKNCWDTLASDTEAVNSDMVLPILKATTATRRIFRFCFSKPVSRIPVRITAPLPRSGGTADIISPMRHFRLMFPIWKMSIFVRKTATATTGQRHSSRQRSCRCSHSRNRLRFRLIPRGAMMRYVLSWTFCMCPATALM